MPKSRRSKGLSPVPRWVMPAATHGNWSVHRDTGREGTGASVSIPEARRPRGCNQPAGRVARSPVGVRNWPDARPGWPSRRRPVGGTMHRWTSARVLRHSHALPHPAYWLPRFDPCEPPLRPRAPQDCRVRSPRRGFQSARPGRCVRHFGGPCRCSSPDPHKRCAGSTVSALFFYSCDHSGATVAGRDWNPPGKRAFPWRTSNLG